MRGDAARRRPWRVAVADPRRPGETLGDARARRGRRRHLGPRPPPLRPGRRLHHLIDPATGEPAIAGPLAVTVVAPDPAEAEAHATALAISGLEEAAAHVAARPQLSALYVPQAGEPVALGRPAARVPAVVASAA